MYITRKFFEKKCLHKYNLRYSIPKFRQREKNETMHSTEIKMKIYCKFLAIHIPLFLQKQMIS